MIKKIMFTLSLTISMLFFGTTVHADVGIPHSTSINGIMPDGTSIYEEDTGIEDENVQPRTILGYEYVPNYERLVGKKINKTFAYIYATSINYSEGVKPTYTMTVKKTKSKSTSWNVSGTLSGEFNINKVKTKLQATGGYNSSETVVLEKGETWTCEFTTPGAYELTWYMRGHKYTAQCGTHLISTGSDDGDFYYKSLGTVTFPTEEIHFDVTKE